jgi:hypothetical protein
MSIQGVKNLSYSSVHIEYKNFQMILIPHIQFTYGPSNYELYIF